MANKELSSYATVTLSTGTIVGLQAGVNVQYEAASFLLPANNLSDIADAATAQTNLGLGTAAPLAATNNSYAYLASIDGATVAGHLPKFTDTLGTIVDSAITFSIATANYYAVTCAGSVTIGHFAIFKDVNGTLEDLNISPSNASETKVASVLGTITAGHLASFNDTVGTVQDAGVTVANATTTSNITVTLTTAEVIAAYATPQLLIPAVSGKVNIITRMQMYTAVATAFTAGGVGVVQYGNTAHGAGTLAVDATTPAVEFTAGASQIYTQGGVLATTVSTGITDTGIYFSNQTQAFATGTGSSVTFVLQYMTFTASV